MKPEPYIGITGFMTPGEAKEAMNEIPKGSKRRFMVGVLASPKTIYGSGNRWSGRYPTSDKISDIFPADERAFNLIHYGDGLKSSGGLRETLIMITENFGGPNLHGFQLNMAWPEGREIAKFKNRFPGKKIVLQAGKWSLRDSKESAMEMVRQFKKTYPKGLIDYLILDISAGLGDPLSPQLMLTNLEILTLSNLGIGFTVAGGLSAKNLHLLGPIVARFPDISIDAEDQLRDKEDDHLILPLAKKYVRNAYELFNKLGE